ncbi:MAG: ABC transporter permease [Deinococcus sp.]
MLGLLDPLLVQLAVNAVAPILLAALAGALCERAGVFNIALEGQLLVGAFAAVVGSWFTHSPLAGVLIAVLTVTVYSGLLALVATLFRGDLIVVGIAMNLLALGLTAFLLRLIFGVQGAFSDPGLLGLNTLSLPGLAGWPYLDALLNHHTWIVSASWLLTVLTAAWLFRTPWGLRLRGVGERPDAAATLGASVNRYRAGAVLVAGALCGLAGAQLSIGSVSLFAENMSAGRGWIAVVAVVLGRAHP